MILCDTNVIIETFKGDEKTIKVIESIGLENIAISSVTVMELYFGAYNKRELNKIKKNLKALKINNHLPSEYRTGVKFLPCLPC